MMANPFLSRYAEGSLLVKTNTGNLFWLLLLMVAAGLAILVLSLFGPGITGTFIPPILIGFVVATLTALLLLVVGQFRVASWIAFAALLAVVSAVSMFSRSGLYEMDLFQTVTIFFLGLMVLAATGVGGLLTLTWVLAGAAVMAYAYLVPAEDVRLDLTIQAWNHEFNPLVIGTIYLAGSIAGSLLLVQGRRNLKLMQFDQDIIEASNQMLEQTVEDRTRALKTILDSSGQGLFTFGSDFTVDPDYSKGARDFFDQDLNGLAVDELLFPHSLEARKDLRQGLALYFDGRSKAAVIFDLLEKETFINGRSLLIDYREAGPGRVLCVLTDVTADRALAERSRADEARRTLVLKALGHKRFFAGLLAEAEALFATLRQVEEKAGAAVPPGLLAAIHTFKGNCGFFGFNLTQEVAHDFEYAIADGEALGQPVDYHDLSLDLKRSYYQELNIIIEALGRPWLEEAGGIVVPRPVFDKIARYIGKKFTDEAHLVDVLEHFRKMPLRDIFSRFPFIAQSTAEKLGKKLLPMEVEGGEIRVVPDRLDRLASACVHLVNNMVDHGIELPYVREAAGKPPEGRLKINMVRENSSVVLQFIDDGQGVSFSDVEARARSQGLLKPNQTASPRELLQYLFVPGFSTRDEATNVSGRGIGLSAVRAEAERLGGRIEMQTKPGAGTTFEIILPIGLFANRRVKGQSPDGDRRRA